jgi:hypothetical protein
LWAAGKHSRHPAAVRRELRPPDGVNARPHAMKSARIKAALDHGWSNAMRKQL